MAHTLIQQLQFKGQYTIQML